MRSDDDAGGMIAPSPSEQLAKAEAGPLAVRDVVPAGRLAGHYHDTGGHALSNIDASLSLGLRIFDASVGGLGGCPYAPGAAGNVATEDVVNMLHLEGIETGIDLNKIIDAGAAFGAELEVDLPAHLQKVQPFGVLSTLDEAVKARG